jgi:hypothetical protein
MKNKLFCNQPERLQVISRKRIKAALVICTLAWTLQAAASDAPQWMHALVNAPLPAHDEKTDAVLLYSETNVTIVSADKIKSQVRQAYKILRPEGRWYGSVHIPFKSPDQKINNLHGWSIPALGKDYEVKDKEAFETSYPGIDGGELISDLKVKRLSIPAPDPGNIIGYEYEIEERRPLVLTDEWVFQEGVPLREGHYSLQLPTGWEYKAAWINHSEIKPTQLGSNQWQWVVSDVKAIHEEEDMPPVRGLAAKMIVYLFPAGGSGNKGYATWPEMGNWYQTLASGRRDPSPEIKLRVLELTVSAATPLDKMRALAQFVQHDIRYVAIELGIGGLQPHPAADIFAHRYGDCKDKATLMASMLHEVGIDSYYVVINSRRGSITPDMPANDGFNHVILAIKLPDGMPDPSLIATIVHPKLGRILFFDPTNELTPFGQIGGYLQANYGLLVMPGGGDLLELPQQSAAMNSIRRTAKLTLEPNGRLHGDVEELRLGDRASSERWALRTVAKDSDRIKSIEDLLAGSLSNFSVTKATILNLDRTNQPFGFHYSFEAQNYAKNAGDLILVRPRVIGVKSSGILETKEPRQFAIEFPGPVKDIDSFEITLPPGYEVDDLPAPVDADFAFASYHSKTEVKGNVLGYSRTFEVKQLSVPASQAQELKKFYRIIAGDERNTAVLKPSSAAVLNPSK